MSAAGIIIGRLGSSRLPGKMLYPLGSKTVVEHIVARTQASEELEDILLATSKKNHDSVLAKYANERDGIPYFRGSESDVLSRVLSAAEELDSDVVVRICGDNPLLSPKCIDAVVREVSTTRTDYAATNLKGSFPIGLDVEAFSLESFREISKSATEPRHREHVTSYYKENQDEYCVRNIQSDEVFDNHEMVNQSHLRLTLDTPADYELFQAVYTGIEVGEGILNLQDAIKYIQEHNLSRINESVEQRSIRGK